MKFRILIIIIGLFTPFAIFGQQSLDSLMVRRYVSCQDIIYNMTFLIPESFENKNYSLLDSLLNYWEKRCGKNELIIRTRIISSIEQETFTEDLYDSTIIYSFRNYYYDLGFRSHRWYDPFEFHLYQSLDTFFSDKSNELLLRNNLSAPEKFFVLRYSHQHHENNSILSEDEFAGTKLQEYYLKELKMHRKIPEFYVILVTGTWIPHGKLSVIGIHPLLGARGGVQLQKLDIEIGFDFKFLNSREEYVVFYEDSAWRTNRFFGTLMDASFSYKLFEYKKNRFNIIGGLGLESFEALNIQEKDSRNNIDKSFYSLNINGGLGYKFHLNHNRFIGVEGKYNVLNFRNPGGTDLSGNAFTLKLTFQFPSWY